MKFSTPKNARVAAIADNFERADSIVVGRAPTSTSDVSERANARSFFAGMLSIFSSPRSPTLRQVGVIDSDDGRSAAIIDMGNDNIDQLQIPFPESTDERHSMDLLMRDLYCLSGSLVEPVQVEDAESDFFNFYNNVFIDPSRAKVCRELCPRLIKLAAGTLCGQMNCFICLGAKGIGKTLFFQALGKWWTERADVNATFMFRDLHTAAYDGQSLDLMKWIHDLAVERGWDGLPENPWKLTSDCAAYLLSQKKKIFIVLDEFEQAYTRKYADCKAFLSRLHFFGGDQGVRSVMIVLTGSCAHLRMLCFCGGSREDVDERFVGGYEAAVNLNNTKFLEVELLPLYTVADMKSALVSLKLIPDIDFNWINFSYKTRGAVRRFIEAFADMQSPPQTRQLSSITPDLDAQRLLLKMWEYLQTLDLNDRCPFEAYDEWAKCCGLPFRLAAEQGYPVSSLHKFADSGWIRLLETSVCFYHPADIAVCAASYKSTPVKITDLEMASLIFTDNASMDEVNEPLVCEAIVRSGLQVYGFGKLSFVASADPCHIGFARRSPQSPPVPTDGLCDILNPECAGSWAPGFFGPKIKAAKLRKECPDELGSDFIGAFQVHSKGPVKWLLVRIQVKLGLSNSSVDKKKITPVVKMKSFEGAILKRLGLGHEEVVFVTVLWTSRPTKAKSDIGNRIIVISSGDMLTKWPARVQEFVRSKKLVAYGFPK